MRFRTALAAYALVHAVLYCTVLPLWEGYDEPFHYAYVDHLLAGHGLPVLDSTGVSEEIWKSMHLAPTSSLNARNMPWLTSYTAYFAMEQAERGQRRAELFSMSAPPCAREAGPLNYEAQQPPLAYLILAPAAALTNGLPLPWRVWLLRVFGAFISIGLFLYAMAALGNRLRLKPMFVAAAIFVFFSIQNVFGSIAHVANDWLSLPLIPLLFVAAERFWRLPDRHSSWMLAGVLAAGLLAKSYFLLYVPLVAAIALWRGGWRRCALVMSAVAAIAGPWYVRNHILYDSLTGLQSGVRAIPTSSVWKTFTGIPWHSALPGMARGALWTANNSFMAFSRTTLDAVLLLLVVGWIFWIRGIRKDGAAAADGIVAAGTVLFGAVPVYAMALFGTIAGQAHANANSWYSAGLLPGAILLAIAGCSHAGRAGGWVACALAALSAYIVGATYFAKLIPLYAGYEAPSRLQWLAGLYRGSWRELLSRLSESTIAGGPLVAALALIVSLTALGFAGRIGREVVKP